MIAEGAWWSAADGEWVLGHKDARGKLHGLVRYWRPDGTLVAETRFRHGVLHGHARRVYEDGTTFQTCRYEHGKLHGARVFYPPASPTREAAIPGWDNVRGGV